MNLPQPLRAARRQPATKSLPATERVPHISFLRCGIAATILTAASLIPARAADLPPAHPATPGDAPALRALLDGRAADAQSLLHDALAQDPSDSAAHLLLCRVFYSQDQADPAIHACEAATQLDPHSSSAQLWLGRAYGLKARRAGPITGFTLARKVHAAFEAAVQLDPANADALSDLGEYYVDAPSIVGGGDDKARALAARILPRFAPDAHRILALLAQDNKDLPAAESEFKLAISSARPGASQAGGWIDLARFYQTHNRPDDAVAALRTGLALDRNHGPLSVEAAAILTAAHREPALAERCLRDYLAGRAHSDSAPTFKVHLQLAQLLAARGQSAEATRETAAAAALAPQFHTRHPAQGI